MLEAIITWDQGTFLLINSTWHSPLFDRLFPFVTSWKNFAIPFLLVALLVTVMGRLRGLHFVILAVVTVLVADAISARLGKNLVERTRPCHALEEVRLLVGCTTSPSFPSNHAVNASVLATLALLYARLLLLPAAIGAMLVAYSRVYVGVHYPLDVLAGVVLGVAVALTVSGIVTAIVGFFPMWQDALPRAQRRIRTLEMDDH